MVSGLSCQQIVNSEACPIDELDSPLRQQTIGRIKAELGLQGCAVIPNFLGAAGLQTLLEEALSRKDNTYFISNKKPTIKWAFLRSFVYVILFLFRVMDNLYHLATQYHMRIYQYSCKSHHLLPRHFY